MKTLVFSDSHLNLPFDEKKFKFLENLIKKSDRVIINGDFWEGFLITFDQFIDSQWKHLFPLLKAKKTVYIYGNHDNKQASDYRTKLFSEAQATEYTLQLPNKTLIFEHGDKYVDLDLPFGSFLRKSQTAYRQIVRRADELEKTLVRTGTIRFLIPFLRRLNRKIKHALQSRLQKNEIVICGHTHTREIDINNQFINTGFVKHGLAQYMIIDNDRLVFKEEWYH